jgi:nicotinamide riboside kinase
MARVAGKLMEPKATNRAVFIVGASSVGKTTLCSALARHFGLEPEKWIREVAREVMRTQGFTRDNVHEFAMQHAIMSAQLDAERSALSRAANGDRMVLLSDRSAVDPAIYAQTSRTDDDDEYRTRLLNSEAFQAILPFYRLSLFGKQTILRTCTSN